MPRPAGGTRGRGVAMGLAVALLVAVGFGFGPAEGMGRVALDLPEGEEPVDLDPAAFTTGIDNRYWPMRPGTRWTYREIEADGAELTVVVTVTTKTRLIANGVTALVVRDTVSEHGVLVEDTLDWYAQDAEGNVWYLGEKTAEFEEGRVVSRQGSWEAGVGGALPGVAMPAAPVDGLRYRQEYLAGEAEDNGEVLSVEEQVEVPAGRFTGGLLTRDTNGAEPDVSEDKLYAPGVGPVLALGISGGGGREELLEVEQVGRRAARQAGAAGLGEPYPGSLGGSR